MEKPPQMVYTKTPEYNSNFGDYILWYFYTLK